MACFERIIVSGVEGRDRRRGGEGEKQGKVMPLSQIVTKQGRFHMTHTYES